MADKNQALSVSSPEFRVVVVGGGIAGFMTTIKLCEAGIPVDIVSLASMARSQAALVRSGINAALRPTAELDSPDLHFDETIEGGDFLANQPPVKGMTDAAPSIVNYLSRLGVPFNRTEEGLLAVRSSSGSQFQRTVFAGDTTGLQVHKVLDAQVRRFENKTFIDSRGVTRSGEPMVRRFDCWEFLSLVLDDNGRCVGVVAQDMRTMDVRAFRGEAVCLATGGLGMLLGRSTNSVTSVGSAAAKAFQQGAIYANGEFIQMHPATLPGEHKHIAIAESVFSEGARFWIPKDPSDNRVSNQIPTRERDYFLERMVPRFGNLAPFDVVTRSIAQVCAHGDRKGTDRELSVYLDLSHLPESHLRRKLSDVLDVYERHTGINPCHHAMKVSPAVHASMGGLWVDYERNAAGSVVVGSPRNHATSIAGLYAVGEVDYAYHGANRIEANSMLSSLYGGFLTGQAMASYVAAQSALVHEESSAPFEAAEFQEREDFERILRRHDAKDKGETLWDLKAQLSEVMLACCTIERSNEGLDNALATIDSLSDKLKNVKIRDNSRRVNQSAQLLRRLENMVVLARVLCKSARYRDESRGTHHKAKHGKRDDERWLRTTLAKSADQGQVQFVRSFDYVCAGQGICVTDAVDTSLVAPRERRFDRGVDDVSAVVAQAKHRARTSGKQGGA